jgi:hypothetical protein
MSQYPTAIKPKMVGQYDWLSGSGGGYFYDELLEYRVWVHGKKGGDICQAFATFEEALAFSEITKGAEKPLALVKQYETVCEEPPNTFTHVVYEKEPRITEWLVEWLEGSKREGDSIAKFLAEKNKS